MKEYVIGKQEGGYHRFILGGILSALLLVVMLLMLYGYGLYYQLPMGPKQPIPFSHRVHAGEKQISCVMCHDSVMTGDNPGLPPLETCMLCHSRIITRFPPIEDLRNLFFAGQPVSWQRVKYQDSGNYFPDFVYFNHAVHIQRSIDCSHCHGPVDQMDRIVRIQDLNMGFCRNCHIYYNASHDCYTCHR